MSSGLRIEQLKDVWETMIKDRFEAVSTSGHHLDIPLINNNNLVVRVKGNDSKYLYVRDYSSFFPIEYPFEVVDSFYKEQFNLYKLILPDFDSEHSSVTHK